MANNTTLNPGAAGDVIRDVDKTGVKTPVCIIDVGGAGVEVLLTAGQAVMAASVPVVIASNQTAVPVSDGGGSLTVDGTVAISGTLPANLTQVSGAALALGTAAAAASLPGVPASLVVTGTGVNVNDTPIAATDCLGYRWVSVQLTGTFTQTLKFEWSNDNANWLESSLEQLGTSGNPGNTSFQSSPNVPGLWEGPVLARYFRVRVSSASSGTSTATAVFSASAPSSRGVMAYTVVSGAGLNDGVGGGIFGQPSTAAVVPGVALTLYNNSSWNPQRNNHEVTVLASAARTAAINSSDQTNFNARTLYLTWDITAAATGTLTCTIKYKDSLSGKYVTLLASAAQAGTGTVTLKVGPDLTAAANTIAKEALPRVWRAEVTGSDGSSWTYSVSANYSL